MIRKTLEITLYSQAVRKGNLETRKGLRDKVTDKTLLGLQVSQEGDTVLKVSKLFTAHFYRLQVRDSDSTGHVSSHCPTGALPCGSVVPQQLLI